MPEESWVGGAFPKKDYHNFPVEIKEEGLPISRVKNHDFHEVCEMAPYIEMHDGIQGRV